MPSPTPTPPGTPTQVYVRFVGERPEGIACQIGCDGEENAPPETRKVMALVAHSIAAAFLICGDAGAADRAERLAEYIAQREGGDQATAQPPNHPTTQPPNHPTTKPPDHVPLHP